MKSTIRIILKLMLPSSQPPVLVASMGRSGSTLVYNSLIEGMSVLRFGFLSSRLSGIVRDTAWSLEGVCLHRGRIYKTHDFPDGLRSGNTPKVIFLFGSASDAARSILHCEKTYGRDWIDEHFEHLSASGPFEDVPVRDVLRFGEQLQAWLSCESVPVLALRYEDLWDVKADVALSRFVGFPVRLPAKRQRSSAARPLGETELLISQTYADLDARIAALPAIIANRKARLVMSYEADV